MVKNNEVIRWDGVFENIFLFETLIEIKKGKIIEIEEITNYVKVPNAKERIKRDDISNFLFEYIKNYRWKKKEKFDCSEEFEIRIGKNGKIDQVKILGYTDEELRNNEFFEKGQYNHCVKSIENALKKGKI